MPDPGLVALRQQKVFIPFVAVDVQLKTGQGFQLLDSASEVTFGNPLKTYRGRDPDFGSLARIDAIEEGVATSAPQLRVAIYPANDTVMALIAEPANQGSYVTIWAGAINPADGSVYVDDEPEFIGELNRAQRGIGLNQGSFELDLTSFYESFFASGEGYRLNNQFHQKVHPGEKGLEYVNGIQRDIPWGQEQARTPAVKYTYSPPISGTYQLRRS